MASSTPRTNDANVTFDRITKFYGRDAVLVDFSLSVRAGEFVTLLGPSGSVRGEEVKACIVLQDGLTPAELPPDRVVQACRERLAAFKVPRYVQYYRTLPKTASEKIAKKPLADGEGEPCSPIIDTASRPQV